MSSFLSLYGPAELILQVLLACETSSQVHALASTCRHTRGVYLANAAVVIWHVHRHEIPAFNEALIAARAAQLVIDAESRDELPPMNMMLDEFSGYRSWPTVAELHAILRLKHLADAVEVALYHDRGVRWPDDNPRMAKDSPEKAARMLERKHRLHIAIYRSLAVGAALAGAYSEPLFRAKDQPVPEIRALAELDWPKELDPDNKYGFAGRPRWGEVDISSYQCEFLQRFAVLALGPRPEDEEAIFGPVAEWLLENILSDEAGMSSHARRFETMKGRAKCCRNLDRAGSCPVGLVTCGADSDAHFVLWQLMLALWGHERVEAALRRRITHFHPLTPNIDWVHSAGLKEGEGQPRVVLAVRFGSFRSEYITLPQHLHFGRNPTLSAHTTPPNVAEAGAQGALGGLDAEDRGAMRLQPSNLQWMFATIPTVSKEPNYMIEATTAPHWAPVPPIKIKFFEYFLRRYFHARFVADAFRNVFGGNHKYEDFITASMILLHDPDDGRHGNLDDLQDGDFSDGSKLLRSCAVPVSRIHMDY
ncbi:hypothetical protein GQ53DRAFT_727859 [Thozetella sp. PMI_491]|nr:hypothetical protein GQ53DRAFT_727859 [Thozetella sp. PMI_491]